MVILLYYDIITAATNAALLLGVPRKSPDFLGKWRPKLLVDLAKGGIHRAVLVSNTYSRLISPEGIVYWGCLRSSIAELHRSLILHRLHLPAFAGRLHIALPDWQHASCLDGRLTRCIRFCHSLSRLQNYSLSCHFRLPSPVPALPALASRKSFAYSNKNCKRLPTASQACSIIRTIFSYISFFFMCRTTVRHGLNI